MLLIERMFKQPNDTVGVDVVGETAVVDIRGDVTGEQRRRVFPSAVGERGRHRCNPKIAFRVPRLGGRVWPSESSSSALNAINMAIGDL